MVHMTLCMVKFKSRLHSEPSVNGYMNGLDRATARLMSGNGHMQSCYVTCLHSRKKTLQMNQEILVKFKCLNNIFTCTLLPPT